MNTHQSTILRSLFLGTMVLTIMFLLTASTQPTNAAPMSNTVTLVMEGNAANNYDFTETGTLVGRVVDGNGSGLSLPYRFQVQAKPDVDPPETDHWDMVLDEGEILIEAQTDADGYARYELNDVFFDANDVGTWIIRFTVFDGSMVPPTADLNIVIDGFGFDRSRPNTAERNITEASDGVIEEGSFDSYMILDTDIPGVTYVGTGRYRRMQAPLIALLEHLVPLATEENLLVRVTSAWDPDSSAGHSPLSTHNEGRAVDLKGRFAGVRNNENPQEVRRLALLVQEAAEEAGFQLFLDSNNWANSDLWIYAEAKFNSNQERLPGQDHVHVSVKGEHHGPFNHGAICDSAECLNHVESFWHDYSGAAAAAMVLEWQGWDSSLLQHWLYWLGSGWEGTDCETMAFMLNSYIDRGWTCVRTSSRDEALRAAAFWMDLTQEGNENGMPFPILIPMDGEYASYGRHWVAAQGYIATADPSSQGSVDNPGAGNYEVGGLFVIDPYVEGSNRYAKRFITNYELAGNYQAMESQILPNLGITYAQTGPPYTFANRATTWELVVPAGCARNRNNPINTLAAVSTMGVDLFCDSQYSIVNPPGNSTVSTAHNVRVIALGPANAIDAYLTVKEDTQGGNIIGTYAGKELTTATDFIGKVWEFDMWQPGALIDYRLSVSADLDTGVNEHCGSTIVTATLGADGSNPQVSFLRPLDQEYIEVKQEYRIQVRALDNQGIQKNSFNNDLVEVNITHRRTGVTHKLTTYELCGPNCYEFRWLLGPQSPDGEYQLTANAIDIAGNKGYSNTLKIPVGQGDPISIDQFSLRNVQVVENKHMITVTASGGLERLKAYLEIRGPDPLKTEPVYVDQGVEEELLDWIPRKNGQYTVTVWVYDTLNNNLKASESKQIQVTRNDIIQDGRWERLHPSASPGVKNAAMVDTGEGVYLFGGKRNSGGNLSNKLWKWDGTAWTDQTPPSPSNWPSARQFHYLVFDHTNRRLVLFGGLASDGTVLRDIWEYSISTKTWTEKTVYPIPSNWPHVDISDRGYPEDRGQIRMTFDPAHNRTLLIDRSRTWLWNTATRQWESNGTGAEFHTMVATDFGRNIVVRYLVSPIALDDVTYEWDGSNWKKIVRSKDIMSPTLPKSNLASSPFGVYLVGGSNNTKELWLWDGAVWTKINASQGKPPKTDYHSASVAYDSARNQLVVYTTNGETWVYSSTLENLSATPKLYDEVWPPGSGKKLGPGMELTFRPYPHPNVKTYEVQFSENSGASWQACEGSCGVNLDGIIQHHGDQYCGYNYQRCLKREQSYSYRVRPLNQAGQPMLDWTYVFNATSFDWPAHVEIEAQTPGPYQNGETVTLNLKNSYGQGMKVDWIISAWGGATATVVEGCGQGYNYKYLISQTCTLTISYQTAHDMQGVSKLSALEPPTSVYVTVKGTDVWNNTSYSDRITLNFESGDEPPRITKVEPWLYPAEYEPGKKYGPGMRLEWIHSPHPERAFYEIQFSEDGGTTWQVYKYARDDQWDWVNHHGKLYCEHGFYRCLKRNQVYHYRIRALDSAESPITDWSDVVSATSMEWPAHVEIAATPPGPQYPSNTVVTLDLVNTYGSGLQIEWELFPHGQANFTILDSTCQNGTFLGHAKVQQCKLRIWVNANTSLSNNGGSMKLAAPLLAFNSVRVVVTGTDSLGFSFTDDMDLSFKQSNGDPIDK